MKDFKDFAKNFHDHDKCGGNCKVYHFVKSLSVLQAWLELFFGQKKKFFCECSRRGTLFMKLLKEGH